MLWLYVIMSRICIKRYEPIGMYWPCSIDNKCHMENGETSDGDSVSVEYLQIQYVRMWTNAEPILNQSKHAKAKTSRLPQQKENSSTSSLASSLGSGHYLRQLGKGWNQGETRFKMCKIWGPALWGGGKIRLAIERSGEFNCAGMWKLHQPSPKLP